MLAERLTGAHFGIIEAIERAGIEPDDLPIHVHSARLANTEALGAPAAPAAASGAGLEAAPALAACIGEAIERYSAAMAAPGAVVWAPASEIERRAGGREAVITPASFSLFSGRQLLWRRPEFPFTRWRRGDLVGWTRCTSLATGKVAWIPAVFVFQPYQPAPGEPLIAPGLSTGLACGRSREEAIASGLREAIERDAIALAWLGGIAPARIEASSDMPPEARSIIDAAEERGHRWALFDLTTDLGTPVAAAAIEGHSPVGWITSFGSACNEDRGRACSKALLEAAHSRVYVKSLIRRDPRWRPRRYGNVTSFADHARFYSSRPELRRSIERWLGSSRAVRWTFDRSAGAGEPGWALRQATRMAPAGLECFAADITPPDVKELGLHVARVVVPGLQPLHGHHAWRHLGGRRLRRLDAIFGCGARRRWRWNPFPHPFP